jgi:hypothetical protein
MPSHFSSYAGESKDYPTVFERRKLNFVTQRGQLTGACRITMKADGDHYHSFPPYPR